MNEIIKWKTFEEEQPPVDNPIIIKLENGSVDAAMYGGSTFAIGNFGWVGGCEYVKPNKVKFWADLPTGNDEEQGNLKVRIDKLINNKVLHIIDSKGLSPSEEALKLELKNLGFKIPDKLGICQKCGDEQPFDNCKGSCEFSDPYQDSEKDNTEQQQEDQTYEYE